MNFLNFQKKTPYQLACSKQNYKLYTLLQSNCIKIRVVEEISYIESKQYDLQITSLQNYPNFTKYFDSLKHFIGQLSDPESTSFNAQRQSLTIYAKVFEFPVQVDTFVFDTTKTIKKDAYQILAGSVLPNLYSNDDLTPQQTKAMLKHLNESMYWVLGELKATKDNMKSNQRKYSSNESQMEQQIKQKCVKECSAFEEQFFTYQINKLKAQMRQIRTMISQINTLKNYPYQNKAKKLTYQNIEQIAIRTQDKLINLSVSTQIKFQRIFNQLHNLDYMLQIHDRFWQSRHDRPLQNLNKFMTVRQLNINGNEITTKKDEVLLFCKQVDTLVIQTFIKFIKITGQVCIGITQNPPQIIDGQFNRNQYLFSSKQHLKNYVLKQGALIHMKVDRENGTIQWKIQDQVIHQIKNNGKLKDKRIKWVALIYLHNKGTSFRTY